MTRVFAYALLLLACGSPAKPAPATANSPPPETTEGEATEADAGATAAPAVATGGGIPMSCASNDAGACFPEAGFVKRFCNGSFPDVALVLFSKEAPFTRLYVKSEIDAWNAEGGASARTKLLADEEVLALRRREAP